ncbi:MAG: PilZ domain-containing protein [Acidobacteria bacterium]|nr:PilZ domain-containing protein [Acidobacteriota bacterium]
MARAFAVQRMEKRIPMEVAVQLSGNRQTPGVEMTFTEDVSSRGARVVTVRRWQPNDRVVIASLPGDFRATARVAYCQPRRGEGFAIGLEFLEPAGRWVVNALPAQEYR